MTARANHRISLSIAVCLTVSACGGGTGPADTARTPAPAPTSAATPQDAAQAMGQTLQQLGQQQGGKAVEFERLIALLPEPAGWTRSKPRGDQISMGMTMSRAQASYEQGDTEIDIEIVDTAFNQLFMAGISMFLMENYSERTSDGYKKGLRLAGHPGYESWENDPKRGEVTVIVANRFAVIGKGTNVENVDAVKAMVQAVDLSRLASLK